MSLMQNNRILVVDDNPAIHKDFKKILHEGANRSDHLDSAEAILFGDINSGPSEIEDFEIDSAMQGREGLTMVNQAINLGRPYAMAFVDVRMPPGWDGIETVARMWEAQPDLQVVICTAYSDYSWEDMMRRFGRSDNLLILKKPFDNVEVLQLAHALTKKWQVTRQASLRVEELDVMVRQRTQELQAAHDGLRSSEERFSKAFRASPIPMAIHTLEEGRFADANDAFHRMTGYNREQLVGFTVKDLALCAELDTRALPNLRAQKSVRNLECQVVTQAGELRQALLSMELFNLDGQPHVLMIAEDQTDRRKLESELRQAQKMEAVGQLAAGVAHDFNNILTIIQGHASLQLSVTELDQDVGDSFKHIASAAERAANLTRQLLAFSRKQVMQPKRLDLNALVRQIGTVLPRLIGEHIRLVTHLTEELPPVFADDCNMEQIVLNLSVNARDAMPSGGTLTVRTEAVHVDDNHLGRVPEAITGRYVCLSVSDTGIGMDVQTRNRIFEPFFTTKEVGKGTGMGLATVYGIVKQHDGWLEVESESGAGSTFRVYLPVCEKPEEIVDPSRVISFNPRPLGAGRTVLVVEDDPSVRGLVKEILIHYHYRVIEAADGEEATALAREHGDEIALLLTDMVMPRGVSGRELAARLTADHPDLKVIYTSGYSPDLFDGNLTLEEGVNYLPKPYTSAMLAEILRGALTAGQSPQAQVAP
ncbi:MAG TPA: response regulator [Chthoniobacteraceae bacterium]|jgi:PAS domain S-box-containing protein|nr:response regulator [Chthoniobacteraceae bacterium]